MNCIIYCHKKNFDVQKAERFFKERRIPYTLTDIKKNPPGRREIELFLLRVGPENLIDWDRAYLPRKEQYSPQEREMAVDALFRDPTLICYPVIRCGQKVLCGYREEAMLSLIQG